MKYQEKAFSIRFFVLALSLAFAACAGLQQNRVADVEGLLERAGFTRKPADTPEKLAHLKSLPQHKNPGRCI